MRMVGLWQKFQQADIAVKRLGDVMNVPAEHFAQTVNKLKGKITILFITHQLPKGLLVDEVVLGKTEKIQAKSQNSTELNRTK